MNFGHLQSFGKTDVGRRRANNEDSILLLPEDGVFVVADGMGGPEDGEVASSMVVDAIGAVCCGNGSLATLDAAVGAVRQALADANDAIRTRSKELGRMGTGTTVVSVVFDPLDADRAVVLHAGDSRLYQLSKGTLEQVTRDHSLEESVGGSGTISPLLKSVITQAIGVRESIELEETAIHLRSGDVFLLCSDGLTNMVPDDDIAAILGRCRGEADLAEVTEQLVDAANKAGGKDNISVIVMRRDSVGRTAGRMSAAEALFGDNARRRGLVAVAIVIAILVLLVWLNQ